MRKPPPHISMLLIVLLVGMLAWSSAGAIQHDRANQALIAAAKTSNATAAIAALDTGADPNARDDGGFLSATWRHLRQRFYRLRGKGAPPDGHPEGTALIAAFEGQSYLGASGVFLQPPENAALVEALLHRGADVNAREVNGETALLLAILEGYTDSVKLLLEKGANVNVVAERDAPGTPLTEAAAFGNTRIVEMILARGAGVNVRDTSNTSPLLYAAEYGRTAIVKALLISGADANAKDSDGWTALMRAAESGRTDTVKALLEAGAQMNAKDAQGYSALKLAAREGHPEIVRLLKKAGAR